MPKQLHYMTLTSSEISSTKTITIRTLNLFLNVVIFLVENNAYQKFQRTNHSNQRSERITPSWNYFYDISVSH